MSPIIPARALACLALCAGAAHAALPPPQDAADPRAAVPPTVYQPAVRYRTAPPATGTPDRNWLASNAAVTRATPMAAAGHDAHADADADAGAADMHAPRDHAAGEHGHDMHDMHDMHNMHDMHEMHETPPGRARPGANHQHGEAP